MNYAKVNAKGKLEYFNRRTCPVINPSESYILSQGYMVVPTVDPDKPVTAWSIVNGALVPTYGEPYHKPPRTFSKLKAIDALSSRGLWESVKQLIYSDEAISDRYEAANVFSEDDPYFKQGLAALKTAFEMTDEQVEKILAECVAY